MASFTLPAELLNPPNNASLFGRSGNFYAELGAAWNVPTTLTWARAALSLDVIAAARRTFSHRGATPIKHEWSTIGWAPAPGFAIMTGLPWVTANVYWRYRMDNSVDDPHRFDPEPRPGFEYGVAIDADGRLVNVPIGLLIQVQSVVGRRTFSATLLYLAAAFRIGLSWTTIGTPDSWFSEPATLGMFHLRVDWVRRQVAYGDM